MPIRQGTSGSDALSYDVLGPIEAWIMYGLDGDDGLTGDDLADRLYGGAGHDSAQGGDGADALYGEDGEDTLSGGLGNDRLEGGSGADLMWGGDGTDQLTGGLGIDRLWGDAGNDRLYGDGGADKLYGGDGRDYLFGYDGNDVLDGGAGGYDRLDGGDGADTLHGDDTDTLLGGAGNDVYYLTAGPWLSGPYGVNLGERADEGYDIVRSNVSQLLLDNFEGLQLLGAASIDGVGNGLINNLQGNDGDNRLEGKDGADTLSGGGGEDLLLGGRGNDRMSGGNGADVFAVDWESLAGSGPVETDTILDFSTADGDILDLSRLYDGVYGFGDMTLTYAGGVTTLRIDAGSDGRIDYQLRINGDVTGDSGGWML